MSNSTSIRVDEEWKLFDENLMRNIIKAGGDKTTMVSRHSLIVKYFKLMNDRYLELVKMGVGNV